MTPDAFAAVLAQVKQDEGFRRHLYFDTTGHRTIGYGFNIDAGITEDQATALVTIALTDWLEEVTSTLPWTATLDDVRLGVVLQLAFNLGQAGLLTFHQMLGALEAGNYRVAALALTASAAAHQEPARVARWAQQLTTGVQR